MQAESCRRQTQHAVHRRSAFDDARILARIPDLFHIAQAYGLSESAVYRNIKWCENTLAKSKAFRLPGRKSVAASERVFDIVLIDATETPIERPKKQRRYYSGKQKRHTADDVAKVANRARQSTSGRYNEGVAFAREFDCRFQLFAVRDR